MGFLDWLKNLFVRKKREPGRENLIRRVETRREKPAPAPAPPPKPEPELRLPPVEILEINSTDEWNEQVAKMSRELYILEEFLRREEKTINSRAELRKYADSVAGKLEKMRSYIGEKFPEPWEIDETTTEKLAGKIVKFVANFVMELCNSSYNGLKYTKGGDLERQFYKNFRDQLEIYMAKIGVDRDNIKAGESFKNCREFFDLKPHDAIQTDDDSKDDVIAEIEFLPHFVHYRTDEGDDKKYILGKCKVYKFRR